MIPANADVAETVANLLSEHIVQYGLKVIGVDSHITGVDYIEEKPDFIIRTDTGYVFVLKVCELRAVAQMTDFLRLDYQKYLKLELRMSEAKLVAEALGFEDPMNNDVAQTVHDQLFTDQERATWKRWIPGGTATISERNMVGQFLS